MKSSTSATKHHAQINSSPICNAVVGHSLIILQNLTFEGQNLMLLRDARLFTNNGLHGVNGVAPLDFKGDVLTARLPHEDLVSVSTIAVRRIIRRLIIVAWLIVIIMIIITITIGNKM